MGEILATTHNLDHQQDSLNLREQGRNDPLSLRTEEIQDRVTYLLQIGISKEAIAKIQYQKPTLYHKESVHEKIEELRRLGFSDPVKMIINFPSILCYSIEGNIKVKIEELKKLGFVDPVKMIVSFPTTLGLSIEENIKVKIEKLRKLGFSDPVKMIVSLPTILNYSTEENIKVKIEELRRLGFSDPVKMITNFPAILSLSVEENIKPKIQIIQRIYNIYHTDLNPCEVFELIPSLLGIKKERFWIIARALKEGMTNIKGITSKRLSQILFNNIEGIVIAIAKNGSNSANIIIKTHLKIKQSIAASGMTKQEYLHNYYKDDQENKVYKRYLRTYPKKKA